MKTAEPRPAKECSKSPEPTDLTTGCTGDNDHKQGQPVISVNTKKLIGADATECTDTLSVEEPLEIRLTFGAAGMQLTQPVAVTMRTPGNDRELTAGFLFTEGIVSDGAEIEEICLERCNVITVKLREGVEVDPAIFERHSFVASSCGVCGKKSIAAVRVRRKYHSLDGKPLLTPDTIHGLPATLKLAQTAFASTGGIHASGLYDATGKLLRIQEDVGRHNALDKVIGSELLSGTLPLSDRILVVSGRASFELVQKAAHAGIPVLAAVGAPSSLAVQLANECGMTLLGFVRDGRFNIYTGGERITDTCTLSE